MRIFCAPLTVRNLAEVLDQTFVFQDDLIKTATATLSEIKEKHNKRKRLGVHKTPKKSKNAPKIETNAEGNENIMTPKQKSERIKKQNKTVFVGIHSR